MKIVLVTPRNPRSFWTFSAALPLIEKKCLLPNLSMPTIAGLTPREHEVILVDENVEEIDFDIQADIIGVTGYIVHKDRMLEIVSEFRRRGQLVVIGGPMASLVPEQLRGRCDVLFVGEAEETWPAFLEDFAAGRHKTEYQAAEKPDLSLAPPPRFDLLDIDAYQAVTMQFGRGCPFRCEFCDIIVVYGRRPRVKTVEQILCEVNECHRLGVRQIFIADDNFIGNKPLAKQLLRALADWGRQRGYPISFGTELSVNVAQDEELLDLIREANMTTVFLGIESPRATSLQETKKVQNVRGDLVESVHAIQRHGIQVQAGMIVGFDNDDPAIFAEQVEFIQAARIPLVMLGMLQAFPKTPLYERVAAEGRLRMEALAHDFGFSNIEPAGMTRLELYRGYRDLVREVYSAERFGERTRAFLFSRGDQVPRKSEIRLSDIRVIGRFLLHVLLRESAENRRLYFGLIRDAIRKRPVVLRDAASFALSHYAMSTFVTKLTKMLDADIELLEKEAARAA